MRLTLIRGLPGSGKSTLAKRMFGAHLEADMYFMKDGEYKFDMNQLADAHEWCRDQTRFWLAKRDASVIVSNTFTTVRELQPYFDLAAEFVVTPNVILCQNEFQNVHNVPEEVLQKMHDRFEYDISELYK